MVGVNGSVLVFVGALENVDVNMAMCAVVAKFSDDSDFGPFRHVRGTVAVRHVFNGQMVCSSLAKHHLGARFEMIVRVGTTGKQDRHQGKQNVAFHGGCVPWWSWFRLQWVHEYLVLYLAFQPHSTVKPQADRLGVCIPDPEVCRIGN